MTKVFVNSPGYTGSVNYMEFKCWKQVKSSDLLYGRERENNIEEDSTLFMLVILGNHDNGFTIVELMLTFRKYTAVQNKFD